MASSLDAGPPCIVRPVHRRLSLTAERWEDDSQAVYLRMAVAGGQGRIAGMVVPPAGSQGRSSALNTWHLRILYNGQAFSTLHPRVLCATDLLAGNLECLRLVCTDSGQTTSAFLRGGKRLRELQVIGPACWLAGGRASAPSAICCHAILAHKTSASRGHINYLCGLRCCTWNRGRESPTMLHLTAPHCAPSAAAGLLGPLQQPAALHG